MEATQKAHWVVRAKATMLVIQIYRVYIIRASFSNLNHARKSGLVVGDKRRFEPKLLKRINRVRWKQTETIEMYRAKSGQKQAQ